MGWDGTEWVAMTDLAIDFEDSFAGGGAVLELDQVHFVTERNVPNGH